MITFTQPARDRVLSLVSELENTCLRLAVDGGSPLAPEYDFSLVDEGSRGESDQVVDADGFTVLVDEESVSRLRGMTIDWMELNGQSGFVVRPPAFEPAARPTGPLADRVQDVLDRQVNPGIAAHGGEIILRGVEDGVVYIEMAGGCQGCAMSRMTLRQGVERMVKEAVPEVLEIRDVTDHAGGENPYYTG